MVNCENIIGAYEIELIYWIKENFKELGYDEIVSVNSSTFPDFIMKKEGKEVKVEAEIFASSFVKHKHNPQEVDEVLCVVNDANLPVKTIKIEQLKWWEELNPDELVDFFKEMPDTLLIMHKNGANIDHFQKDWVNLSKEDEEKIRQNLREKDNWRIKNGLRKF